MMNNPLPNHLEEQAKFELYRTRTLPAHWASLWRQRPSEVVVAGPHPLSADEMLARSEAVAQTLLAAGLRPGDRVILSAAARPDVVVAYVALLRAGLVVVPVNTAYRRREVEHILKNAEPRGAIVDSEEMASWLRDASPELHIVSPSDTLAGGGTAALDTSAPGDLAMICYTSGTTGAPKGAMLLHRNLMASAEGVTLSWRWRATDRLILALPLFHLHGLGVGLNGTLTAGASVIILDQFSPESVLAELHDATLFFGVPAMYQRLIEHPNLERMRSLRLCVSGSAPLPTALHLEFFRRTGHHILERYGMTETLMNVSHLYDGERRPGTVGYPLPGVEMRLENERAGEISVRGPNVFVGYWRNQTATSEVLSADGWFRTGDVGALDGDGQLRLVARTKELIISGGYNVYPREVEDVLRAAPGVRDVAVVGIPSVKWGEAVIAYAEGAFEEAVIKAVAEAGLAPYKRPKSIFRIDALPKNALGKVIKHILRDQAIRSFADEGVQI